ncbi:MAG: coenzyme PQQ synthesis c-like domain protein [Candidatus Xenolissoclinum pacificiensis L6]|uniref:Coenzyme PQQ synthesis c-like domain protein n=1 Tax=Candidatus Xenolissoclinum pacificiensis L6 TaxID=1401685 RepID=W2V0I5_9RICK|nr:MAG: coenzyme PQQ synthesis c-like domain protein [Candidatus Xenolissoclinum pacificiensis L6]
MSLNLDDVKELIKKYDLLKTRFYEAWQTGRASLHDIREYVCAYYHHIEGFPRAIALIYAGCDNYNIRKILFENIAEEEGFSGEARHSDLWIDFATSLSISEDYIRNNAKYSVHAMNLLKAFTDCAYFSYEQGLGALYAYEYSFATLSQAKLKIMTEFYGYKLDDKALSFFKVHSELDIWHTKQIEDAIMMLNDKKKIELVYKGAEMLCKAFYSFLDEYMYQEIHIDKKYLNVEYAL